MEKARFIISKSRVIEQHDLLRKIGLSVSYSLKTNPEVGRILEDETDCMFSVHSREELGYIKDNSRVWFLADSWDAGEIEDLLNAGINKFIVYNQPDLKKLMDCLDGKKTMIDLLLRAKLRENSIFTEKYFVFGMDARTVNERIHQLRGNRNIRRLGVHFHRKTQNIGEWHLRHDVERMLESITLEEIDILNIGGGLPVAYRNSSDSVIPHIFNKIRELKQWLEGYGIETLIEPGRFIAGPAARLETEVINRFGRNLVVNCSVYNSSIDTLILPIKLLVEGENESGIRYTIKGCTPCSLDIFRYSVRLPKKDVGDRITFLNAGAYNFHTDFCSLKRVKTEIVD